MRLPNHHQIHHIIYNPVTYWPSTLFKIKLRLVAVDLGQFTGFLVLTPTSGWDQDKIPGLVVSRTPSAATTNIKWLEWNVRVVQVVDSCGLREFILVLEKDLLRWVNVSRTIQKV